MKHVNYNELTNDFLLFVLVIVAMSIAIYFIAFLIRKRNKIKYTGISNKVADSRDKYNKTGKW